MKPPSLAEPAEPAPGRAAQRDRAALLALVVGSLLLAGFPWAYAFELVGPSRWYWASWSIGVGVQCLALLRWRQHARPIALTSLLAILGLWVVHGLIVYGRIVTGQLNVDFLLVSIWISAAARDLLVPPANGPFAGLSYFAYYLDPIVPLLDRLLGLTDSPFRLLAFQAVAALSPSLAVWMLAVRNPRLAPFQLALPTAYLLHPALFAYVQQDYHATAIGSLPIFLGCLLFFRGQVGRAYPLLVLGSLTKLSYWIIWPAFALVALGRRRWLALVAYGATPILAALAFWLLQPAGQAVPSSVSFLFGSSTGGSAAMLQQLLEMAARGGPRLWFFMLLLAGFGFVPLLAPLALLPAAPLALVALIERTGLRALLVHQYASEYLAFLLAASVLGLLGASTQVRIGATVALAGGMLASVALLVPTGQPTQAYEVTLRQSFSNALATRPAYDRAAGFTACAVAGQPALWAASQTDLVSWGAYPRPPFDGLWIDQAPLGLAPIDDAFYTIPPDQWAAFETLVYVSNPVTRASLARFPMMNGLRHQVEYTGLLQRLPVEVAIDRGWTYRGGDRLAACAGQYGYPSRTVVPPAPITPEALPALARFPCEAEVERIAWWLDRSDPQNRRPDAQQVVTDLLQATRTTDQPLTANGPACFLRVQAAQEQLGLAWSATNPPPPAASCEQDARLARLYEETVFDDRLRAEMQAAFAAMTSAEARQDQAGCLIAAAMVRQAYVNSLGLPAAP